VIVKFIYQGSGLNNYYGINAANGDEIEATEEWIISKMENHPDFKAKAAPKKKAVKVGN